MLQGMCESHSVMPAGVGPCEEEGRPGDVPAHDAHLQRGRPHQGGSPCLQRHAQVHLLSLPLHLHHFLSYR